MIIKMLLFFFASLIRRDSAASQQYIHFHIVTHSHFVHAAASDSKVEQEHV